MTTIFIEADEPLLVFSSVEMAEQHIEAVDVHDGIYTRAFGRAGEPYSITTEGECVVIRPIEGPADPESLLELLRRSLQGMGETVPHDADLPTLAAATEAVWTKSQRFASATSRWSCIVLIVMLAGLTVFIWA